MISYFITQARNWNNHVGNRERKRSAKKTIYLRRSWFADFPLICATIIMSFVCFWATVRFPGSILYFSLPSSMSFYEFPIPFFGIFPLMLISVLCHRHWDAKYSIADVYASGITGLLSFRKNEMRVEFKHLRGMDIEQTILGRFFDVGTLMIGTAMREDVELNMYGIRHPAYYRDIIARAIQEVPLSGENREEQQAVAY